jgi:hypothetical protein
MGWSSRNRLPNFQTAGYDRNHVGPKGRIAKDGCGTTVLVPTAWRFKLKPLFRVPAFQKIPTLTNAEIESITKLNTPAPCEQLLVGGIERQNITRCFNKE